MRNSYFTLFEQVGRTEHVLRLERLSIECHKSNHSGQ